MPRRSDVQISRYSRFSLIGWCGSRRRRSRLRAGDFAIQGIFIITRQDIISSWKLERFLHNVDISDQNKYMLLYNEFDAYEADMVKPEAKASRFITTDYIKKIPHQAEYINTSNIAENTSFQKIAYYLL
jgi:hypothetical protein